MVHASPGPARAGVARPAERGRRSCAGSPARTLGDGPAAALGGVRGRLRRDPRPHRAGRARASTTSTTRVREPGGFALPHPPRDELRFPTADGQAQLHASTALDDRAGAGRAGCCCRPCAPTTSTTPRSTASTTATAASTSGRRVVFVQPRRPGRARLRRRRRRSTWSASTTGQERRAPRLPGRRLPDRTRVLRRLLPRDQRARPARQHAPRAATPRPPSRSSSASNRSADPDQANSSAKFPL